MRATDKIKPSVLDRDLCVLYLLTMLRMNGMFNTSEAWIESEENFIWSRRDMRSNSQAWDHDYVPQPRK
jgi:hypothetical protein